MRYPHHLLCTRITGGTQDPDTGAWVPGASVTVYDGPADVQDEGETVQRDADGRPTKVSDAVAYIEDEIRIGDFRAGDSGDVVTVTWADGTTEDARVIRAVRLDGKLHLERL